MEFCTTRYSASTSGAYPNTRHGRLMQRSRAEPPAARGQCGSRDQRPMGSKPPAARGQCGSRDQRPMGSKPPACYLWPWVWAQSS